MGLTIVIISAIIVSLIFHFIGVYINAKKAIWSMLVFMWVITIGIAMNEIKPGGYKDIEKMKGQYADTDALIDEAMPKISLYEMLSIKKSYFTNNSK
ncbi:MAG: hypothetical protein L3J10_08080 [Sulfurimonas sp.]|nr:hypothetical protein [Sulfurimonas sp.]